MSDRAVYRQVPYSGYPQHLLTHDGTELSVVIDATAFTCHEQLWGMSLLERNLRTVDRLGRCAVHILAPRPEWQLNERRRFGLSLTPHYHDPSDSALAALRSLLPGLSGPVLLLSAEALYDRRLLASLWQHPTPAIGVDGGAPLEAIALIADAQWLVRQIADGIDSFGELQDRCIPMREMASVDLQTLEHRVTLLRKTVAPKVVRVASGDDLRRADRHLKEMAGKGINDLVGEYVHPPIEFLLTRIAALTPLTPNHVSYFVILLSLAGLYFFAAGRWWEGVVVNLVRGVVDGVDGKLARLTLRESRYGNLLDHGTDTVYLPLLFLALGWGLSGGDPTSPAAVASYILQVFYWLNRILASWFKALLGVDESEFRRIDRTVRRIQPKRNIFIVFMMVALTFEAPQAALYGITTLTILFCLYRIGRIDYEARFGIAKARCW